jgi:hypothetical protein
VALRKKTRVGHSPGQKVAYLAYISALNTADFDLFPQFYHPEIVVNTPGLELKGRDGGDRIL